MHIYDKFIYTYLYACINIPIYTYVYMHIYIRIYTYVCICIFVCIYLYIPIHIFEYSNTCIHQHMYILPYIRDTCTLLYLGNVCVVFCVFTSADNWSCGDQILFSAPLATWCTFKCSHGANATAHPLRKFRAQVCYIYICCICIQRNGSSFTQVSCSVMFASSNVSWIHLLYRSLFTYIGLFFRSS